MKQYWYLIVPAISIGLLIIILLMMIDFNIFWFVLAAIIIAVCVYFFIQLSRKQSIENANDELAKLEKFEVSLDDWDLDKYGKKLAGKKIRIGKPISDFSKDNILIFTDSYVIGDPYYKCDYLYYHSISSISVEQPHLYDKKYYCNVIVTSCDALHEKSTTRVEFSIKYINELVEFYKIVKTILYMKEQKEKGGLYRKFTSISEIRQYEDKIKLLSYKKENLAALKSEYESSTLNLLQSIPKNILYFSNSFLYALLSGDTLSECVLEKDGFDTDDKQFKKALTDGRNENKILLFLKGLKNRIKDKWGDDETLDSATYIIFRNSIIDFYYKFYIDNYNSDDLKLFCSKILNSDEKDLYFYKFQYTCYVLHNDFSLPIIDTYSQISKDIDQTLILLKNEKRQQKTDELELSLFSELLPTVETANDNTSLDSSLSQIERIDKMTGEAFEEFIASYFADNGFKVTHTPISGDYGIDVIIENEFIKIGIQTKRYDDKVTNSAVQEVVAGIKHYGLDKGMVITNNYFTKSAKELAKDNNVTLWDRNILKSKIENIKN